MNYKKLFVLAKEKGISDLELYISSKKKLSIEVFHKKVERYSVANDEVLSARGIVNGKMGMAFTEDLQNIESVLDLIVKNASNIEDKKEVFIFEGSPKYVRAPRASDSFKNTPASEKIKLCLDAEEKLFKLDPRIAEVEGVSYEEELSERLIINSKGLKLKINNAEGVFFAGVVAKENDDVQTAFAFDIVDDFARIDVDKVCAKAVKTATDKLNGEQAKSKKYKTVLAPNVFASLVNIFMNSINGQNVVEGRSMFKDKLNQPVASSKFTLIENPHYKDNLAYFRSFDDEGVATYKKSIVEKGILKTFIYNLEYAKKAGTQTTGNGFKGSALGAVGISTTLLEVKNGKKSASDLYEQVKEGILINDVQGLHAGINPISGNFSLQASGRLIEGGKLTSAVRLITIGGNLFEMFNQIVALGNDSEISLNGVKCPSVYVKKLAISGK